MTNVESLVEIREGWWWPKSDSRCWSYMQAYPNLPFEISEYVLQKRIMVQAGGNCGFYPKKYASIFEQVYTFEPEWLNFYCLNRNIFESNVIKFQACLGDSPKLVDLNVNEKNRGKTHISGTGKYPVFLIDNLGLTTCDLIHLDIEGYEYFALLGAVNTIKHCQPVVVIEMWDQLDNRFGKNLNQKTEELLTSLSYKFLKKLNDSDKIFIHENIFNKIKK
jgi:FkbM family methyltransferase